MESGSKDVEQQFLLRLPEDAAENLRRDLENGSSGLRDKLLMEIDPDLLKGKVVYDGQTYEAKLFDLPCMIESYKTTNKKVLYKTADISQILVCSSDVGENKDASKNKKYQHMNGLCRPFRSISKRRFKKVSHKAISEQPDINKELRRLLASDSQATDVIFRVVEEEEPEFVPPPNDVTNDFGSLGDDVKDSDGLESVKLTYGSASPKQPLPTYNTSTLDDDNDWSEDENYGDIFGDVSSSDDDENSLEEQIEDNFDVYGENSNSSHF